MCMGCSEGDVHQAQHDAYQAVQHVATLLSSLWNACLLLQVVKYGFNESHRCALACAEVGRHIFW